MQVLHEGTVKTKFILNIYLDLITESAQHFYMTYIMTHVLKCLFLGATDNC